MLTFGAATVCPAFHSSSSWVEIGTRTMLMPRSAIALVISVMLADHRPWKTRSDALKPNQLVPVSQTAVAGLVDDLVAGDVQPVLGGNGLTAAAAAGSAGPWAAGPADADVGTASAVPNNRATATAVGHRPKLGDMGAPFDGGRPSHAPGGSGSAPTSS